MSKIFITGDLHGGYDIEKLLPKNFPEQDKLTKNDYLIICGDFGCVWNDGENDIIMQEFFRVAPYTVLFVDGNHEGFPILNSFPISQWNGGKVHIIDESIIHLMRGQVFNIDGIKFFTMGGATSHDKQFRIKDISWWDAEMPSFDEYNEALDNLAKHNNKVDIIISHCAPNSVQAEINPSFKIDQLTNFFEVLKSEKKIDFQSWFFGHYHRNKVVQDKFVGLYDEIIEII